MNKSSKNLASERIRAAIAAAAAAATLCMPCTGTASLQGKMDSIFNDMTNVTKPGVFNAARRGIISGGSVINRSRLVNSSLWNIAPPHIAGGCGGIDIYGGSFSFINADQFVELLRAIAANAKGYAFKVALEAASSMISVNLDELQRAIQMLNMNNINSCQLAQGLVNTAADALGVQHENQMSLSGALHGFGDISQAFQHIGNAVNFGKEAYQKKETSETLKKDVDTYVGNYVWNALKKKGAKSMLYGADENETTEYETIMSMTGTVVAHPPEDNASASSTSDYKFTTHPALIKDPDLLINGGAVSVYKCSDSDCLTMSSSSTVNLVGLKDRILSNLLGDGSTTGIIARLRNGSAMTDDEKKVLSNLPNEAGLMISNLSLYSDETARAMAADIAYAVAGRQVFGDMLQYIDTTIGLVQNSDIKGKEQAIELLKERHDALQRKQIAWNQDHKTIEDLYSYYEKLNRGVDRVTISAR